MSKDVDAGERASSYVPAGAEALRSRLVRALDGRYRVEREVGAGGMAIVFLAVDLKHDRHVALKVLHPDLGHAVGADRFLREIRIAAKLEHPHVLTLLDSGDADGLLYYVMPYVEGESLRERISREGQLGVSEALRLAVQVADALAHAHARGIVHRDIKPENILLSSGHAKVADFGIAKAATVGANLTQTGLSMGTPAYMSPEQIAGDADLDGRSDLYSLGCVLYEMLTGAPPFAGPNSRAMIARRLTEDPPRVASLRATVSPLVDMVLARALSREPAERQATIGDFGAALLSEISGSAPVLAPAVSSEHATIRRSPLVGREKELADAREMLGRFAAGHGGILLIGGEPGVGKTRLSEAIMDEARAQRALCLVGRCYEMEGTPPYNPFAELLDYVSRLVPARTFRDVLGDSAAEIARILPSLRQTFPDIPPPLDLPAEQQRQYLFTKYREFNERACRVAPIVVLLDDLHWADESSLLLLEHAATYLSTIPILILGTYRDVELEVNRPFARTLERLTRGRYATRIALRRLTEDRVADLLAGLGGGRPPAALVRVIFQETEGNPFFVEEVFQHLAEEGKLFDDRRQWRTDLAVDDLDVPEGVRLVIGRRLERLSDACRTALTSAAVIGPRFRLSILDALGEADPDALLDALDEAERAKLIIEQSVGRETIYAFSHELIRQTLLGTLSLPRRQRRHLKVSIAMEKALGDRVEHRASDLAYHLYQAGTSVDTAKTLRFLLLAAHQAMLSGAFQEVLQHCDRALSIDDPPDRGQVAHLVATRGSALKGLGRWDDAFAEWSKALAIFEQIGDAENAALMAVDVATLLAWSGHNDEGLVIVERCLGALDNRPTLARGRLLAMSTLAHALCGDDAMYRRRLAEGQATAADNISLRGRLLGADVLALFFWGRFEAGIDAMNRAVPLLQGPETRQELMEVLGAGQALMGWSGQFEAADAHREELDRLATEAGHVGAFVYSDSVKAFGKLTSDGDIADFGRWAAGVEERWKAAGPWGKFGEQYLSNVELLLGDWDAAADRLRRLIPIFPKSHWSGAPEGLLLLVDAYRGTPDWKSSLEQWRHLIAGNPPRLIGVRFFVTYLAEAYAVLGMLDESASLYSEVAQSIADGHRFLFNIYPECTAGISAAAGGNWKVAEAHFSRALEATDKHPKQIARWETRRWYAWMLLRRREAGDVDRARTLLAESVAEYRRLGMQRHAILAERMMLDDVNDSGRS